MPVTVVEGYVDVIAMVTAGYPATVAPLGTALTEDQLALLWRMADEPVLCFDGDPAGHRAAYRAIDLALPHIRPGKSLLFASLPQGHDPDDLVRTGGPGAVADVLAAARPRPTCCGRGRRRPGASIPRNAAPASKRASTSSPPPSRTRRFAATIARNSGSACADPHGAAAAPRPGTTGRPRGGSQDRRASAGGPAGLMPLSARLQAKFNRARLAQCATGARGADLDRGLPTTPWLLETQAEQARGY